MPENMTPLPEELRLNPDRDGLTLRYAEGEYVLTAEFLRVYSPSAEVRGHGIGQEVLQTGKRMVRIAAVQAVGNYAVKIAFSDGHDSGLYDWAYLHRLCRRQNELWQDYLHRLDEAGADRDTDLSLLRAQKSGCGHKH